MLCIEDLLSCSFLWFFLGCIQIRVFFTDPDLWAKKKYGSGKRSALLMFSAKMYLMLRRRKDSNQIDFLSLIHFLKSTSDSSLSESQLLNSTFSLLFWPTSLWTKVTLLSNTKESWKNPGWSGRKEKPIIRGETSN